MLLTKLKTWTTVVLVIALLGTGAGFLKSSVAAKAGDEQAARRGAGDTRSSPPLPPDAQNQPKADAAPEPPKKDEWEEQRAKKVAELKPLVERLSVLTADLDKGNRSNTEIVDLLFVATLVRLPKESEQTAAIKVLKDAKDRTAVCRDIVWALVNSKEFLKMHELDKNVAESLHVINSLSEVLDRKPDADKSEPKKH